MKLAILSRAPRAYSTQRLRTAALDRGHEVRVLNTLRFAIDLTGPEPDLQFRGRPLSDYDAILPRIGNSITYFGTAVVRQFEQMDIYTPNTANGIANARDKLRATQILSRHNIGMPATTFVRNRADVIPAIERVGGAPVVIKLLEGTQGIGVILAPDIKIAEAIIETLHSTKQNVLIQSFVTESRGRDIRALVVGVLPGVHGEPHPGLPVAVELLDVRGVQRRRAGPGVDLGLEPRQADSGHTDPLPPSDRSA